MKSGDLIKSILGLPASASDEQTATALRAALFEPQTPTTPATPMSDDPQVAFHELAERTSAVLGISLSDAYSRVSQEAPTLYQRASAKASLN